MYILFVFSKLKEWHHFVTYLWNAAHVIVWVGRLNYILNHKSLNINVFTVFVNLWIIGAIAVHIMKLKCISTLTVKNVDSVHSVVLLILPDITTRCSARSPWDGGFFWRTENSSVVTPQTVVIHDSSAAWREWPLILASTSLYTVCMCCCLKIVTQKMLIWYY